LNIKTLGGDNIEISLHFLSDIHHYVIFKYYSTLQCEQMKHLLILIFLAITFTSKAQVSIEPVFPTVDDTITVYFDATQGNQQLKDCNCTVYMHAGLITASSSGPNDWKYVQGNWGTDDPKVKMEKVNPNLYKLKYQIKSFYGVPSSEEVKSLAFVFRNVSGSKVGRASSGEDIFYPLSNSSSDLQIAIIKPDEPVKIVPLGTIFEMDVSANMNAHMRLVRNGITQTEISNATEIVYKDTLQAPGIYQYELTVDNGSQQIDTIFTRTVPHATFIHDLPSGTQLGCNSGPGGNLTFVLEAPGKQSVFLVGSLNYWTPLPEHQMNKTPDGRFFWLQIDSSGLGRELQYQYWLQEGLRIPDPLSRQVLDPSNDSYITAETYPGLPKYPAGKTSGLVTFYQLNDQYVWSSNNFIPPPSGNLVIYELLVRDFVMAHDYQTITDSIQYLKRLGVNAIELMPVNEFEGNISWGYNPSIHMAVDKYYGDIDKLKFLIDVCHQQGIAVIADVVFNHAFYQNPMVQMYWDKANNRPATDNPWFNPVATHPYNVGYDFNHQSTSTQLYVTTVLKYWLENYRFDGFRFDLSKGFTQRNTPTDVAAWGAYEPARIQVLKNYRDSMLSVNPRAYAILEHFADNTEEKELSADGFLLWGNVTYAYQEAAMGFSGDLGQGYFKNRNWTKSGLVTYMESHDEERLMYKLMNFGNSAGSYNTKNLKTALERVALASVFFYTIPGPKMLWQFGELGYDYSINACGDGTVNNNCRTDPKPIRWDYLEVPERLKLYGVTAALIHLKTSHAEFESSSITSFLAQKFKYIRMDESGLKMLALGNFDVNTQSLTLSFPDDGWYYNYLGRDSIWGTSVPQNFTFAPGEYRLYLNKKFSNPYLSLSNKSVNQKSDLLIFPQPAASGEKLNIFNTEFQNKMVYAELYSLEGRKVLNEPYSATDGLLGLPLPPLKSGIYLLMIQCGTKTYSGKILVE